MGKNDTVESDDVLEDLTEESPEDQDVETEDDSGVPDDDPGNPAEEELAVARQDSDVVPYVGLKNIDIRDSSGERVAIRRGKEGQAHFTEDDWAKVESAGILERQDA